MTFNTAAAKKHFPRVGAKLTDRVQANKTAILTAEGGVRATGQIVNRPISGLCYGL